MALRAAARTLTMRARTTQMAPAPTVPRSLMQLFSTFTFPPPIAEEHASSPLKAEPSPNLFVSGIALLTVMLIFVGLSKRTTTDGLRDAFAKFGEVVNAKVVTDRVSGYSKGYGFVKYSTVEGATAGIEGMDGKFLDGWVIFAEYARPRPPPGTRQNYGNSSFGGNTPYGGNSYNQ
ncbi:hypothetical protein V2J09_014073 [Rumex salicifolius]